ARDVFARVRGAGAREPVVVYDVGHNIAKVEEHVVDGVVRRLTVHRKGATRAFPGQPVIVAGDMGRYSYLLVGTEAAMRDTFGSTCHGAGRVLSRSAAVRAPRGRRVNLELREHGLVARATGKDALAEQMPEADQDVNELADVVCERVFLPDPEDIAELERTEAVPISLESFRPLTDFHMVGFSVTYEGDYVNVLRLLALARIPLRPEDRRPHDPLVLLGGVCAFSNPEPVAPFMDVIVVGEGEELV